MVVARRLLGLAVVLDELNLSAECTHVGNCALSLVRAVAPWSLKLQLEYAEKEALICSVVSVPTNRPHTLPIACHFLRGSGYKGWSLVKPRSLLRIRILDRGGRWSLCRVGHPDLAFK